MDREEVTTAMLRGNFACNSLKFGITWKWSRDYVLFQRWRETARLCCFTAKLFGCEAVTYTKVWAPTLNTSIALPFCRYAEKVDAVLCLARPTMLLCKKIPLFRTKQVVA
jgi:hypothetical protein